MGRRALKKTFALLLLVATNAFAADEVERLATLTKVWATVKYVHPFLMQREVDWDGAFVRAVPRVRAAGTDEAMASAIAAMLAELNDPATRVVTKRPAVKHDSIPLFRWDGDVLIINLGPYLLSPEGDAFYFESRRTLTGEIARAKRVLVDMRFQPDDPERIGQIAWAASTIASAFTNEPLTAPASHQVFHSSYRPQSGSTSGGYFSGFIAVPGSALTAAKTAPELTAIVTDAVTPIADAVLALRAAGKAFIVSDRPLGDETIIATTPVPLHGSALAMIRTEVMPAAAGGSDVVAADPFAEALSMLKAGRRPPARAVSNAAASIEPKWAPDPTYSDMTYPDVEYRLLAAARIWSVIHYFYPYKGLIGDWDAVLPAFIPRFIGANDADAYASAVLEMVAHVHDGHSFAFGHPSVPKLIGEWYLPLRVRAVENRFAVVEKRPGLPDDADVKAGDVVVSIDGEPFRARVERLSALATASTETARVNRLATIALAGPKESTATLELRGADGSVRTVKIPRVAAAPPPRGGQSYRVLDGNIGYADLTTLTVSEVDAMFDSLGKTRAIIFDMRGYPNGTAWSIAPRINTRDAKVGATFRRNQIYGGPPGETASGFYFEQQLPKSDKPKYTGKTVMLIDDRAISQAEHTGLFFEAASDITFIGTPTAGANGDVTNFTVPGGFRVSFTGHDVRHADGRQLQRVGIQPHIEVAPTLRGLREGRDEVLERAVQHINGIAN